MKKPITVDACLARIAVFDDTEELADSLYTKSRELNSQDSYYLMESRDSLLGMWKLLNDFARALKAEGRTK